MTAKYQELLQMVPQAPHWKIYWSDIEKCRISPWFHRMKTTHQNPVWHGEDDVWTHTRMVCEELVKSSDFQALDRRRQEEVFIAALLHDIGKVQCTKWEDGAWISPNHTVIGAGIVRSLLWMEYGFCGTKEWQEFRETICNLIRYHSVPMHILETEKPEYRIIKIASNGELTPDFSIELLSILVKADISGRITESKEASLEVLNIFKELAKECSCLSKPLDFYSDYSEYAYLSGKDMVPELPLYDDTWGEAVLLSGLPGTGKDTWIREYYGDFPVISLDEIRRQMGIVPTDHQGAVISAAREQAKEYLRKHIPFVWNATNISPMIRAKLVRMFTDYKAAVRIVFLETGWEEQMRRNQSRVQEVLESVIAHMRKSLVLPERFEAHHIEWHCV